LRKPTLIYLMNWSRKMSSNWQQRRSTLNHDWLKNDYINSVIAFSTRLNQPLLDRMRINEFILVIFPNWSRRQKEFGLLIAEAEEALSPRNLFKTPPLSRCSNETKKWLSQLAHELWLNHYPIKQWIEEALEALKQVNSAYDNILMILPRKLENMEDYQLQELKPEFDNFAKIIRILTNRISVFPHKILIK